MRKTRIPLAKRIVSVAACAALAVSLMPANAFALGTISQWSPPGKTATSFAKDGKVYSYIKSATHRRAEAVADYIGLSNVTVQPMRTGKAFPYKEDAAAAYDIASKTGRMGIFGTDVNECLNPWYGNKFYNIYQEYQGKTDNLAPADDVIVYTLENNGPMNADTDIIDEYGTSATLFMRPDVLFGTGTITDTATNSEVSVQIASKSTSGYTELVNKIRNKQLGDYNGVSLAKLGDENYDPWYVKMASGGSNNASDMFMLYDLATAAENIIEATANTATPKITRYGDPMEIARLYEEWILGTQLSVLKAIDEGKVKTKTFGIVSNLDTTSGEVTFTANGSGDTEFLQEAATNVVDADKLEGGVGSAKDIMACDAIFLSSANQKNNLVTILQNNNYTNEADYPDIFTTGPDAVLQTSHECEINMRFGYMLGFLYPEVFNPVDSMAFYYRSFYHIKESALADTLGMQISNMSLPTGVELNIDNYNEEAFRAMLDEAMWYYQDNADTIKAAHAVLEPSEYFVMPEQPVTPEPEPEPATEPTGKTAITINTATVKASSISATNAKTVKTITLGAKVKKISAKAFAKCTNAKTLIVKSTKLTKANVKNSLKGSKITTVKVPKAKLNAYKKAFAKANSGKSVTVKKA